MFIIALERQEKHRFCAVATFLFSFLQARIEDMLQFSKLFRAKNCNP